MRETGVIPPKLAKIIINLESFIALSHHIKVVMYLSAIVLLCYLTSYYYGRSMHDKVQPAAANRLSSGGPGSGGASANQQTLAAGALAAGLNASNLAGRPIGGANDYGADSNNKIARADIGSSSTQAASLNLSDRANSADSNRSLPPSRMSRSSLELDDNSGQEPGPKSKESGFEEEGAPTKELGGLDSTRIFSKVDELIENGKRQKEKVSANGSVKQQTVSGGGGNDVESRKLSVSERLNRNWFMKVCSNFVKMLNDLRSTINDAGQLNVNDKANDFQDKQLEMLAGKIDNWYSNSAPDEAPKAEEAPGLEPQSSKSGLDTNVVPKLTTEQASLGAEAPVGERQEAPGSTKKTAAAEQSPASGESSELSKDKSKATNEKAATPQPPTSPIEARESKEEIINPINSEQKAESTGLSVEAESPLPVNSEKSSSSSSAATEPAAAAAGKERAKRQIESQLSGTSNVSFATEAGADSDDKVSAFEQIERSIDLLDKAAAAAEEERADERAPAEESNGPISDSSHLTAGMEKDRVVVVVSSGELGKKPERVSTAVQTDIGEREINELPKDESRQEASLTSTRDAGSNVKVAANEEGERGGNNKVGRAVRTTIQLNGLDTEGGGEPWESSRAFGRNQSMGAIGDQNGQQETTTAKHQLTKLAFADPGLGNEPFLGGKDERKDSGYFRAALV